MAVPTLEFAVMLGYQLNLDIGRCGHFAFTSL